MRKTRKMLAVLLALVLFSMTALTGCGGDDDDDGGSRKKKPTESVKDDPTSVPTEPPSGSGTLKKGDSLSKALGFSTKLPTTVTLTMLNEGGTNMYMTKEDGHIRNFMDVISEITVGEYQGNTKEKNFNTLKLQWSDGSDIEILYSGSQLIYKADGTREVYSLTGGTLVDAADALMSDVPDDDGLKNISCSELGIKTKAPLDSDTVYDEEAGLYIGVGSGTPNNIPYVLVYRIRDSKYSAKDYFKKSGIPFFEDAYGDDLISYSNVEELDAEMADGTKVTFYGCEFTYTAYGNRLCAYRIVGQFGNDLIYLTGKYVDGDEDMMEDVMEVLEIAAIYLTVTDGGTAKNDPTPEPTKKPGPSTDNFTIVASPASQVKYEKYDNGLFSAEIPKGWVVEVHEQSDYIHYTFQIYDPKNPDLRIMYNMKSEGYWASKADHDFFANAYPTSELSANPWLDELTTLALLPAFFKIMPDGTMFKFRKTTDFKKIESLGTDVFGGEIIHATSTNAEGKTVEGIYSASIMKINLYYVNMLYVYGATFMTAPEGELSNWIEVLEHIFSTVEFSAAYQKALNEELIFQGQAAMEISRICSQTTDIVISGWESRQATYDRISQKQSDATLGYERVYDTEKGEIYRAPLDFLDNYSGSRYRAVTDDQYLLPIDGYIQWK